MSNALSPLATGRQLPAAFNDRTAMPDMNAAAQQGVTAGFAVIGYKGRNWRIKYQGEETLLRDARGAPLPTLDVVIVGVSPHISKVYYEKRYSEGDQEAPNCWSSDGQTPDATVEVPQSPSCVNCPNNRFGSRITEAGKKAKACQDTRRLAVVPAGDVANSTYGGPMLLRLPPMSLPSLSRFAKEVERYGAQLYEVQCRLGFDYDVAYPLITFEASGWVQDNAMAQAVRDWANNDQTQRVVSYGGPEEDEAAPEVATPQPSALAQPRSVPPAFQGTTQPQPTQTAPLHQNPQAPVTAFQPPVAPVVTPVAQQAPPPPPVVAAPPPPPPVKEPELPYQFTPDGKHRWRPGMADWELVPAADATPAPQTAQTAPAATQTAPATRRRKATVTVPAAANGAAQTGAANQPGGAFSGPNQAAPAQAAGGGAFSAPTPQAQTDTAAPIAGTVVVQTSADVEAMVDKLLD